MNVIRFWAYGLFLLCLPFQACSQINKSNGHTNMPELPAQIINGSEQTELYFPGLKDKRIAIVGNHSSRIGTIHLVDSLLNAGFTVTKVFSPEHGFRGTAAAGEHVASGTDSRTGLPVISLYGANRRPAAHDLKDIDLIIFDIQDVGVRFYTYISTMSYMMEEAARQQIPMLVLDRPNPNGHFIDGPLMKAPYQSFVGLHPIPVVHGMTVGEYAMMVNGEGWLADGLIVQLQVIPVKNYNHTTYYELPLAPSPNLPNMTSILLYPYLCFFEGTQISVGRGTDFPFQVYGHSQLPAELFPFPFTPESRSAAPNPPELGKKCQGKDLRNDNPRELFNQGFLNLQHLLDAYQAFPDKDKFFNNFFERLAGTDQLRKDIRSGKSLQQIRESWQADLDHFRQIRKKYLLYPDFE